MSGIRNLSGISTMIIQYSWIGFGKGRYIYVKGNTKGFNTGDVKDTL